MLSSNITLEQNLVLNKINIKDTTRHFKRKFNSKKGIC